MKKEALPKLLTILYPVACKWELFVQQMGVPWDQISLIKTANPQADPSYCLNLALHWWLSNYPSPGYEVSNYSSPVYEIMIDVLDPGSDTSTMNKALAKNVREFITKEQSE